MTTLVASDLDQRIVDVFAVVGLLIAVVTGYLAAIWPVVAGLLNDQRPSEVDDRLDLGRRCGTYGYACAFFTAATAAIITILSPLLIDVVEAHDPSAALNPIRAALVIFTFLMACGVITGVLLAVRLFKQRHELSA